MLIGIAISFHASIFDCGCDAETERFGCLSVFGEWKCPTRMMV
jgi:hypothetical protein